MAHLRKLIIKDDHALIPLGKDKKQFAIIDLDQVDKVNKYNWSYDGRRITKKHHVSGKTISTVLSRFITHNIPKGYEVNYRNDNRLDCRLANLCIITPQQRMSKISSFPAATSKYKGVCWVTRLQRWTAQLHKNGKSIFLGNYDIESDAARAYDAGALEYFGKEYTYFNF